MAEQRRDRPASRIAGGADELPGRQVPAGARRAAALLALLAFLTYAYFHLHEGGWNENSRFALTYALTFDGTFRIDAYHEGVVPTKDKAVFGGHFYTEKAPGSSLWAVPACALHAGVSRLVGVPWSVPLSRYFTRLLALSLPAALFLLIFWRLAFALSGDLSASLWATAAYGLGTQALPYATVYTGHLLAGMFCFSAFVLAFGLRHGLLRRRLSAAALAGLALGWAVLTEYQTVLIGLVVLAYLVTGLRGRGEEAGAALADPAAAGGSPVGEAGGEKAGWSRSRAALLLATVLGGLGPMLFLAYYNWACFGSPFELGYKHVYQPLFRQYMAEGALSITHPRLTVLYGITISKYRGLFFVSPVLVLGLYGWWLMRRRWRAEAAAVAAVVLVYFAFVSSIHVDQWDGGSAFGPRFLIPMIPFLALPTALAYRKQKPLFFALAAVSIAAQFMATATEPQPDESIMDPLFEVIVPRFLVSEFASVANWGTLAGLWEPFSLLPLYAAAAVLTVLIVREAVSAGRSE